MAGAGSADNRKGIRMAHIAVMQPYLFPYLGYYQLAYHVEEFVFFDDVNYIKKGYINRNNILLDGVAHRFTLPVLSASQNRLIKEHEFVADLKDAVDLIRRAYRKAPHFDAVFPLICGVLEGRDRTVSVLAARSIISVFDYLCLAKRFSFSSSIEKASEAKGVEKIIEICRSRGANRYTNAIGGKELYCGSDFANKGIELEFIRMFSVKYDQAQKEFVPYLSMIDVLMHCSKNRVRELLSSYEAQTSLANPTPDCRKCEGL